MSGGWCFLCYRWETQTSHVQLPPTPPDLATQGQVTPSLHPVRLWPLLFPPGHVSVAPTGVTYPTCFKFWRWDAHESVLFLSSSVPLSSGRAWWSKSNSTSDHKPSPLPEPRCQKSKRSLEKYPLITPVSMPRFLVNAPLYKQVGKHHHFLNVSLSSNTYSKKMYLVYVCVMGGDAFK